MGLTTEIMKLLRYKKLGLNTAVDQNLNVLNSYLMLNFTCS